MSDVNLVRTMYTVICFVFFMLVLWYAYNRKAKKNYDEHGRSIIDDEDTPPDNYPHPHSHDHGAE